MDSKLNLDSESGKIHLSNVSISYAYDRMETWLENFIINEIIVDWEDADIQVAFPQFIRVIIEAEIETINGMVEGLANSLLQVNRNFGLR